MAGKFIYRGPRSFYFRRVRYPLEGLRCVMAERRCCLPGGGGRYGENGDGEAYHKDSGRYWGMVRTIRGGQWVGGWRRVRSEAL